MNPAEFGAVADALSKVLAVIVSVIGIPIAASQLTAVARLRRRESWLRDALEREKNVARLDLLTPELEMTSARIAAIILVPGRHLLAPAGLLILAPAFVFSSASERGPVLIVILAVFGAFALLAYAAMRGIHFFLERQRITLAYAAGKGPIRLPEIDPAARVERGRELTDAERRAGWKTLWLGQGVALSLVVLGGAAAALMLGGPVDIGVVAAGIGLGGLALASFLITVHIAVAAQELSSEGVSQSAGASISPAGRRGVPGASRAVPRGRNGR